MRRLLCTLHPAPSALAVLRRPFVQQAGVLQIGSLAALGVSFLLSIALARVLGPDAYGAYALVISTFTTISLVKRLGQDYVTTTDLAAAYARHDPLAAREALLSFNAITLWSTLVVIPVALVLAPDVMGYFFNDSSLGEPLRLALLTPIWAMPMATAVIVLQCSRRVVALTMLENAYNLAMAAGGLAAVVGAKVAYQGTAAWAEVYRLPPRPSLGTADLLGHFFLGQAAASFVLALVAVQVYRRVQRSDPILPRLALLWAGAPRMRRSVWSSLHSGLAVALDKNLVSLYPVVPILLLGSLAPTGEVALLRVAMSYLAVPLLALSAISRLLMVKLPELHATQPERLQRFFFQVTATGGAISIGLTLPFVVLAPWLIGLLYGPEFGPAARLAPLLALDPLLAGFGIAAGPIFRTYGRNLWAVWANVAVLIVGLPLAYLATQSAGLEGAALAYAGLVTALRLIAYVLCLRIIRRG